MRNTRIFLISVAIIVVVGIGVWYLNKPNVVHYHAGFLVYIDGKRQDFSDFRYMKPSPCGDSHAENDQEEKAHLHDGNGDVVHVHRTNAYWSDLFTNIKYSFDSSKRIIGYDRGKKIPDVLHSKITPYESVVIVVGSATNEAQLAAHPVSMKRIKQVESASELCGGKISY